MPQRIPPGLKREHVLQALADLDAGLDHPFAPPTRYELVHKGKHYPPKAVVEELKKASKGLLFPSESDAPFKAFLWKGTGDPPTADRVRALAGAGKGAAVAETSLDDFFGTVPGEDRPRFQKLAAVLKQQLAGVKVYKVGDEPERAVYIVGKAPDGQLAGLQTTVVET